MLWQSHKDAFINDNMKCFKFSILRGEIYYELTRVVKCAGSDSLIVDIFLSFLLDHGDWCTASGLERLEPWLLQDWNAGMEL